MKIKGYRLMEMIAEGKVNDNMEIYGLGTYVTLSPGGDLLFEQSGEILSNCYSIQKIAQADFTVVETEAIIDKVEIQNIEEIDLYKDYLEENTLSYNFQTITDKYNELLEAIKQLDKEKELVNSSTPVGTILIYHGIDIPKGYLPCDGRSVETDKYSELFNIIKTDCIYNEEFGTFNLPIFRNCIIKAM